MLPTLSSLALLLPLAHITLATQSLVETPSKDNSDECECYLTSGPDPGYFQYYRFFDFRNIPNDGDNDYTQAPPLVTASENSGGQISTSAYLNTTDWNTNWSIEDDTENPNSPVPSINSAQNVFISRNLSAPEDAQTYLTLRTSRLPDFMSIAEIDSNQKNLFHASLRVSARILPNGLSNDTAPTADTNPLTSALLGTNSTHPVTPGAVFGFFTYRSDTQESDIEILTQDPTTQIHYSNQPDWDVKTDSSIAGASTQLTLPDDSVWTDWHVHRLDWFDGVSRYWFDEMLLLNKTMNVPTKPMGLVINLWGDGDTWSGNMSVGGQVSVAIEWVEMVFNVSGGVNGKRSEKTCNVACYVDEVQDIGTPVVAFNNTAARAGKRSVVVAAAGIAAVGAMLLVV